MSMWEWSSAEGWACASGWLLKLDAMHWVLVCWVLFVTVSFSIPEEALLH